MNLAMAGLLAIVVLSALGGWWFTVAKTVEKPVKVMMFVGYFWLLAFVQLSLFAAVYFFWRHFF